MLSKLHRHPWLCALFTGVVAASAAGLVNAHGGDSTLIHGCVNQSSTPKGQVIVYSAPGLAGGEQPTSLCGTRGLALDWNAQGSVGPAGATGPTGATGPRGTGNTVDVPTFLTPAVVIPSTSTMTAFGNAATITPSGSGHVLVVAKVVVANDVGGLCTVAADLRVDGTGDGELSQATIPANANTGFPGITIPFNAALTLTPNVPHTVQIEARSVQLDNVFTTPCGQVARTRITLVDLG
jgi:hypothetical protein